MLYKVKQNAPQDATCVEWTMRRNTFLMHFYERCGKIDISLAVGHSEEQEYKKRIVEEKLYGFTNETDGGQK